MVTDGTNKLFADAAEYLTEHGWCQNAMRRPDGSVCAMGALSTAAFERAKNCDDVYNTFTLATLRLHTHLGLGEEGNGETVPEWNDAPERTAEDVILAFKELANE